MLAVTRGRLDMVGLLLEAGADINAQDNVSQTKLKNLFSHLVARLETREPTPEVTILDSCWLQVMTVLLACNCRSVQQH